jgi:hypothetical protein
MGKSDTFKSCRRTWEIKPSSRIHSLKGYNRDKGKRDLESQLNEDVEIEKEIEDIDKENIVDIDENI